MKGLYSLLLTASLGLGAAGALAPVKEARAERTDRPKGLDQIIDSTYKLKNTIEYHADIYPIDSTTPLGEGTAKQVHYASCFGIAKTDSGTYLLTAAHVTKDDKEIFQQHPLGRAKLKPVKQNISIIRYENGIEKEVLPLEEIARDGANDLSLLFTPNKDIKVYDRFARLEDVKLGDVAYTIGYPHRDAGSFGKSMHRGIVSCIETDWPQVKLGFIDSTLDSGMSGGPTIVIIEGTAQIFGVNSVQYDIRLLRNTFGAAKNIKQFLLTQQNGKELSGWKPY